MTGSLARTLSLLCHAVNRQQRGCELRRVPPSGLVLTSPPRKAERRLQLPSPGRELIRGPGQGAGFGEFLSEFHPGIAGVMAGEQLAVVTAGEDPIRLRRMGRERPDRRIGLDRQ